MKLYNPVYEEGDLVDVQIVEPKKPNPPKYIGEPKLQQLDRDEIIRCIESVRNHYEDPFQPRSNVVQLCDYADIMLTWIERASDVAYAINDQLQRIRTDDNTDD